MRVCTALLIAAVLAAIAANTQAAFCPAPEKLGPATGERLVVVVPATGQGREHWKSFLEFLKREPESASIDWLFIDHGIRFTTLGSAKPYVDGIASCVAEKAGRYRSVTLIGHSVGGMLVRGAYLKAAGAYPGEAATVGAWSDNVDRVLLFASVNRGVEPRETWMKIASWAGRLLPHPSFVVEDMQFGSDFIANLRIVWIRHFGELAAQNRPAPRVVQFWGTRDSIVNREDNADVQAFSPDLVTVEVAGATHGQVQRLEAELADDPAARWGLFRAELVGEPKRAAAVPRYSPRRVLFIVRGIRDSANSEWVKDLAAKAAPIYGEDNIRPIEYGYFSALHFFMKPMREKMIPEFRDKYAEDLARNPRTEFDFIGHSNGTYIFGHSLLSTPGLRFGNVVLAAPVLPTNFNWARAFDLKQVVHVRYDMAWWDWPVAILCQAIRGLGYSDVGPSGVVQFGEGTIADPRVKPVGWYDGDHGAALIEPNRVHLLNFARDGADLGSAAALKSDFSPLLPWSRATPWIVRGLIIAGIVILVWLFLRRRRLFVRATMGLLAAWFVVYFVLDFV